MQAWQAEYFEKYKDPRWQKKRLEIFERDKWRCLCCGAEDEQLQVHHLKYSGQSPWDAKSEWLETLCEKCHEWRTEMDALYALVGIKRFDFATYNMYWLLIFVAECGRGDHGDDGKVVLGEFWNKVARIKNEKSGHSNAGIPA